MLCSGVVLDSDYSDYFLILSVTSVTLIKRVDIQRFTVKRIAVTGDGCLLALRARLRKQLCTQKQGAPKYTFTGGEQRFTGGEQSPDSLNDQRRTAGMVTSVTRHRHPSRYKQLIIKSLQPGDGCDGFFFLTDSHRGVKRKSTDSKNLKD